MSDIEFPAGADLPSSRRKLVLIGILGIVLIGVLMSQFFGEEPEAEPVKSSRPSRSARATSNSKPIPSAGLSTGAAKIDVRPFPTITREEALQHDPFGLSPAFLKYLAAGSASPEAAAESQQKIEEQKQFQTLRRQALTRLLEQGVSVVVHGDKGPAATIGTRVVQEGDVVDGFRVERIDADGVILKEAPLP